MEKKTGMHVYSHMYMNSIYNYVLVSTLREGGHEGEREWGGKVL